MRRRSFGRGVLPALAAAALIAACGQSGAPPAAEEPAAETPTEAAMGEYVCDDPLGCVELASGDTVNLAGMFVLSGPNESLGVDSRNGVEIAIDDFGPLMGRDVAFTAEDETCSAEGGQTAASKIAADESIVGVIGTSCSSAAEAAIPIITAAGMVMISPSNTAPRLTASDRPATFAGYLRTAHNDKFQGRVAAEFAYNELGLTTAATIHDGSPYAEQLQAVFAEVFTGLGGTITSQEAVNVNDTDMKPVLTKVASQSPAIIYYPIFVAEGGFITAQAKEVTGLEETVLMGADGLFSPDFVEAAGTASTDMYLTGPYVSGAEYDAFLAKHTEKYGSGPPSGFHAHAYDAATMLLTAISSVAVEGTDGTLYIPRQALRDALYSTAGFKGLTGTLTCQGTGSDSPGDCATGEALAVFRITAEVAAAASTNWPPPVVWQPGE
jgi:branched-chain amino acid transport system substrate-binding protein